MKEYQEKEVRCTRCKKVLHDKNSKNVGQCFECFAEIMSDDDDEEEQEKKLINKHMESKKYVIITGITEEQEALICESLGESHGKSIIKYGFMPNTLPHTILHEDGLMYLFNLLN